MSDVDQAAMADDQRAIGAFRLGWTLAEVRGRIRIGDEDRCMPQPPSGGRQQHDLPLSIERSVTEQQIQSRRVLVALADTLDVNPKIYELTDFRGYGGITAGNCLERLIHKARAEKWTVQGKDRIFQLIWSWDAWIQDELAEGPFGASSAYQLGRGLAEISWALDPDSGQGGDKSWNTWAFLLGEARVEALKRLVDRLGTYFHENTADAIKGSLDAWGHAVRTSTVQSRPEACAHLRLQVERWRDLVVIGLDPCTLADESQVSTLARKTDMTARLVRTVWPQLVWGAISVAVLVAAVFVIPDETSTGTAGTILGALGLTASSISARAKSQANALLSQAQAAYRKQLAIKATTLLPTNDNRPSESDSSSSAERVRWFRLGRRG